MLCKCALPTWHQHYSGFVKYHTYKGLHCLTHEGGANNSQDCVIMHELSHGPKCFSTKRVTFAFLCLTVAIVLPPMHIKVCSK